jgi:hypothetical protein
MDLEFTEEQQMLRDTVRGLCAEHASIEIAEDGGRSDRLPGAALEAAR